MQSENFFCPKLCFTFFKNQIPFPECFNIILINKIQGFGNYYNIMLASSFDDDKLIDDKFH